MKKHRPDRDGWSCWVQPTVTGYRMACCDCGLVHELEFVIFARVGGKAVKLDPEHYGIEFRARRHKRSTSQVRRHMQKADA